MSPYRHGNCWWLRVPHRGERSNDGQRFVVRWARISTKTKHRATAVQMAEMLSGLRSRRVWEVLDAIAARLISLGEVFDAYREDAQLTDVRASLDEVDLEPLVSEWHKDQTARRTASADKYARQIRLLIPAGQRFSRARFTRRTISEHLAGLAVSGSTKNRHRAALSGFAKFLVEREVLEHNPVRDVAASKPNRARMRYLERRVAQSLVASLAQPYRALEALMAGTGMEWQAIAALVDRDVDLAAGTVHAHGAKNEWRERVVRITEPWVLPHIAEHMSTVLPGARVFAGVTEKRAIAAHHEACRILGIEHCTLHDWRHTFAVQALRDGLSPSTVARQLGHHNAHLTFTTYGRFVPDERDYISYNRKHENQLAEAET